MYCNWDVIVALCNWDMLGPRAVTGFCAEAASYLFVG